MRYRKRRRRGGISQNAAQAIIVLLALGVSLYIALATAVGSFMAQKVVAPIINYLSGDTLASAEPSPEETPLAEVSSGASASAELELGGFSAYALQMGAFSSPENAKALADEQKKQGAGGYVAEVDGVYKVLGAVYATAEQAKQVKGQLQQTAGVDSSLFLIDAPAMKVKVTAPQKQLDAVSGACQALQTASEGMYAAVQALDAKQIDQAQACAKLNEVFTALNQAADELKQFSKLGSADAVLEVIEQNCDLIKQAAAGAPSDAEFGALIKYAQINLLYSTAQMLGEL